MEIWSRDGSNVCPKKCKMCMNRRPNATISLSSSSLCSSSSTASWLPCFNRFRLRLRVLIVDGKLISCICWTFLQISTANLMPSSFFVSTSLAWGISFDDSNFFLPFLPGRGCNRSHLNYVVCIFSLVHGWFITFIYLIFCGFSFSFSETGNSAVANATLWTKQPKNSVRRNSPVKVSFKLDFEKQAFNTNVIGFKCGISDIIFCTMPGRNPGMVFIS